MLILHLLQSESDFISFVYNFFADDFLMLRSGRRPYYIVKMYKTFKKIRIDLQRRLPTMTMY